MRLCDVIAVCGLVALGALSACEPLRPEVQQEHVEGASEDLSRALRLHAAGGALPPITQSLRHALERASDEDEVDQARRLLAERRVEWFQMAHISRDLLQGHPDHERAFDRLMAELRGDPPPPPATASKKNDGGLARFSALLTAEGGGTRMVDVRVALDDWLRDLERSDDPEGRAVAVSGRRLLSLDAGWRYGPGRAPTGQRVVEALAFLEREDAPPFADNAWLMLRLAFANALVEHSVPRRPVLDAAARVLGVELQASAPPERLIALGGVPGPTLPEALYRNLQAVRKNVAAALDATGAAPAGSDGRRIWDSLVAELGLEPDLGDVPRIEVLYLLGEGNRASAVARWTRAVAAPPIRDRRSLLALERAARERWVAEERRDALLVMTVLAAQEAIVVRLGDAVRGRAVRLVSDASFLERTLVLPGGQLERGFVARIKECIEAPESRCLERVVSSLVRKTRAIRTDPARDPARAR